MKTRVWWTNPKVKFRGIQGLVPEKVTLDALKCADVIVGCVNNLHARADLMDLAWRYCIPYVDIGLVIKTSPRYQSEASPLTAIAGNVFTAVPGGPCMWCTEFLTKDKLDAETGGRGRTYLQDVKERDAYVLGFNGVLASQATNEVLQLLTGYGFDGGIVPYKRYEGFSGTLRAWEISRNPECPFCTSVLAAGDPVWK